MTPIELKRFMLKVKKRADGCWEWIGGRTGTQYGAFKSKGISRGAHIWMYEHHNKPVGKHKSGRKKLVCHRCDNPWCVQPKHLFQGTYKQNTQDAILKGRMWQLQDVEIHQKVGLKLRGRRAHNKGIPLSVETKRKISRAGKGRKATPEQRQNYSRAAKLRELRFKQLNFIRTRNGQGMFA